MVKGRNAYAEATTELGSKAKMTITTEWTMPSEYARGNAWA